MGRLSPLRSIRHTPPVSARLATANEPSASIAKPLGVRSGFAPITLLEPSGLECRIPPALSAVYMSPDAVHNTHSGRRKAVPYKDIQSMDNGAKRVAGLMQSICLAYCAN